MPALKHLFYLILLPASLAATLAHAGDAAPAAQPAAPQYYQYDPAKLSALERKKCDGIIQQLKLIDKRMHTGSRGWESERMGKRQEMLFADYVRYCKSDAVRVK